MLHWPTILQTVKRFGRDWAITVFLIWWLTQVLGVSLDKISTQLEAHAQNTAALVSALEAEEHENMRYRDTTIRLWQVICRAQSERPDVCDAIAQSGLR
jgi:hypothetical protein